MIQIVAHPARVAVVVLMHGVVGRDATTRTQKLVHLAVLAAIPVAAGRRKLLKAASTTLYLRK